MKQFILVAFVLVVSLSRASAEWRTGDVRYPELMDKEKSGSVNFEKGISAWRNSDTIDVEFPGAYIDSLAAFPGRTITLQLAATAVAYTCSTQEKNADGVIDHLYRGSKKVKQGSGDTFVE